MTSGTHKMCHFLLLQALPLLLLLHLVPHNISALSSNSNTRRQHRLSPSAWTIPRFTKFGALSNLEFLSNDSDRASSSPLLTSESEDNTVKVATTAVGLNFADVFTILGYYKAANLVRGGKLDAFVPGIEFAGYLLEDVAGDPAAGIPTSLKRGEEVFGFVRFGSYADIVSCRPEHLRKLPRGWSSEEGAAFLVNALTAWYGLINVGGMPGVEEISRRESPYVVIVHSASGGVGLWASEIAARRGASVVGVVGSDVKIETFMDRMKPICPSAQCIVRSDNAETFEKDLVRACKAAREKASALNSIYKESGSDSMPVPKTCLDAAEAGLGADLVMECYGGKFFRPSLNIINAGGSLATYGSTTYNGDGGERMPLYSLIWKFLTRPRVDPGELTSRNIRVGGFNLIFLTENTKLLTQALDACVKCLSGSANDDGATFDEMMKCITPPLVGARFDFDDGAIEALKSLRSGKTVGKVVLSNAKNPAACKVK